MEPEGRGDFPRSILRHIWWFIALWGGHIYNRTGAYAGHAGKRSCREDTGGLKSGDGEEACLEIEKSKRSDGGVAANGAKRGSERAHLSLPLLQLLEAGEGRYMSRGSLFLADSSISAAIFIVSARGAGVGSEKIRECISPTYQFQGVIDGLLLLFLRHDDEGKNSGSVSLCSKNALLVCELELPCCSASFSWR